MREVRLVAAEQRTRRGRRSLLCQAPKRSRALFVLGVEGIHLHGGHQHGRARHARRRRRHSGGLVLLGLRLASAVATVCRPLGQRARAIRTATGVAAAAGVAAASAAANVGRVHELDVDQLYAQRLLAHTHVAPAARGVHRPDADRLLPVEVSTRHQTPQAHNSAGLHTRARRRCAGAASEQCGEESFHVGEGGLTHFQEGGARLADDDPRAVEHN
mmetsp:Transcript_3388/g.8460  ORF Transcript_3388/g.8460 Transcript_3388/m.8460 type:complete len:216 (-) Transcript_3388:481-1128(-)